MTSAPLSGLAEVMVEHLPNSPVAASSSASTSGLAWIEVGDPDGRPVVFLHGWPSSRLMGRVWAAMALLRGWRVIAPDRPGIGRSPRREGWSFSAWPAVLAQLMDDCGVSRCPVIGLSGGGPYALASATIMSERVEAVAVVSGAPPLHDRVDQTMIMKEFRILAAVERRGAWLLRAGFRTAGPVVARFDVPLVRSLMRVFGRQPDEMFMASRDSDCTLSSGLEAWRQGGLGVVNEGQMYLHPWGFAPETIAKPTAFWHGTQDPFFDWTLAEKLARRIPGAVIYPVPGEGHFTPIYRVQDQVFDWLERVCAASS